ncbi:calcium-binding protein, partial [Paraburkholderia solisilvae]
LTQSGASFVYGVEQFRFADGTVWDKTTINALSAAAQPKLLSLRAIPTALPDTEYPSEREIASRVDLLIDAMAGFAPAAISDAPWQRPDAASSLTAPVAVNYC